MKPRKNKQHTARTAAQRGRLVEMEPRRLRLDAAELSEPARVSVAVPRVPIYYDAAGQFYQQLYRRLDSNEVEGLRSAHEAGEIELEERPLPEEAGEQEANWYLENLVWLWEEYPSRDWLCIVGHQVISHAPRLADALAKAKAQGHPSPFVARVPRHRPGSMAVIA